MEGKEEAGRTYSIHVKPCEMNHCCELKNEMNKKEYPWHGVPTLKNSTIAALLITNACAPLIMRKYALRTHLKTWLQHG